MHLRLVALGAIGFACAFLLWDSGHDGWFFTALAVAAVVEVVGLLLPRLPHPGASYAW